MIQWGLSSAQKVYDVMATIDWLIQEYTLGGLTSTYTLADMVYGWDSNVIGNLSFAENTNYTDKWFM